MQITSSQSINPNNYNPPAKFISSNGPSDGETVLINGKALDAKKTTIPGDFTIVQLKNGNQKVSGFQWLEKKIHEVIVNDVSIYDDDDVVCISWMIDTNIKMNLEKSLVLPKAFDTLELVCDVNINLKRKVQAGSTIRLAVAANFHKDLDNLQKKCEAIGFRVLRSENETPLLQSFISTNGSVVSINAKAAPTEVHEMIECTPCVRLKDVIEKSQFPWETTEITKVIADGVLIYDFRDIECLENLIKKKIQVDFSRSYVSPRALSSLGNMCHRMTLQNIYAPHGSKITIAADFGDFRETNFPKELQSKCESLGFSVELS